MAQSGSVLRTFCATFVPDTSDWVFDSIPFSASRNVNSRLRNYFFLRRQLGNDYLTLLQFFLNHHRYLRSEDPSRVDKSPAELLTGQPHAHWLELLGYKRFSQN